MLIVFAFSQQFLMLIGGSFIVAQLPLSGACRPLISLLYLSVTGTTSGLTPSIHTPYDVEYECI